MCLELVSLVGHTAPKLINRPETKAFLIGHYQCYLKQILRLKRFLSYRCEYNTVNLRHHMCIWNDFRKVCGKTIFLRWL